MGEPLTAAVSATLLSRCKNDPELARICQQARVDASSWNALVDTTLVLGNEYHSTQTVRAAQLAVIDAHPDVTLRTWAEALWHARRSLRAVRADARWDSECLRFSALLKEVRCDAHLKVMVGSSP